MSINLHGKTLPVLYTYGYIQAVENYYSPGQIRASFQHAASTLLTNQPIRERDQLLNPIYAYFHLGGNEPQPLDYIFVSLFLYGFTLWDENRIKTLPHITRKIGRAWWYGRAPIMNYPDDGSLEKRFSKTILYWLDRWKWGSKGITFGTVKSSEELGKLGIQLFAALLQKDSHIPCVALDHKDNIEFIVHECPFCLHSPNTCQVFLGVIDGLIQWLHGNEESKVLSVNEEKSQSHNIIINIKKAHL